MSKETQLQKWISRGSCKRNHPITDEKSLTWGGEQFKCRVCECDRQENLRLKNPKRYLLTYAKQRSTKYNIPFNITIHDIKIPEFCPVFPDIQLQHQTGKGIKSACSPSLDKIIPSLGYVRGNVQVISLRANMAKQDLCLEDVVRMGEWAKRLLESRTEAALGAPVEIDPQSKSTS